MNNLKKFFLFFMVCFLLFGCDNKYKDYEHYDLKDKDIKDYTVHFDDGEANYTIADISDTVGYTEIQVYGIFLKLSDNDYILLDKFEGSGSVQAITKFYANKLYVIATGANSGFYIYDLNYEKFTKKSIQFKATKEVGPITINDVKDGEIYLFGMTFNGTNNISSNFKCSLDTYRCEQVEN